MNLIHEQIPNTTIPRMSDRVTPLYLEKGRLEVDDSSIKFIQCDGNVIFLPVATLSSIVLGPGTSVTHDAIRVCAEMRVGISWCGTDSLIYYAFGQSNTSDNRNILKHVELYSNKKKKVEIARKMFKMRFPDLDCEKYTVKELMGFEGNRVKRVYSEMSMKYGVIWRRRNYHNEWETTDEVNKAMTMCNSSLYSLVLSVVNGMGYSPYLGFIHNSGIHPFVYDIADLYKVTTTIPSAFEAIKTNRFYVKDTTFEILKKKLDDQDIIHKITNDISNLLS